MVRAGPDIDLGVRNRIGKHQHAQPLHYSRSATTRVMRVSAVHMWQANFCYSRSATTRVMRVSAVHMWQARSATALQ